MILGQPDIYSLKGSHVAWYKIKKCVLINSYGPHESYLGVLGICISSRLPSKMNRFEVKVDASRVAVSLGTVAKFRR